MQTITPFLWFDDKAEEAMNFYVSVFGGRDGGKTSRVIGMSYYGDGGPRPKGSVLVAQFELDGQTFSALNGGPLFQFTEAVSFAINCDTQQQIDYFWTKLTEGGEESQCGWLKDKYGLSWQVIPSELNSMLRDPDAAKTNRVMNSIMAMAKLDLQALRDAFERG